MTVCHVTGIDCGFQGTRLLDQSSSADPCGELFENIEKRTERRKKTAVHAFASDIEYKYNVKCILRDVSRSGCKIVTNSIDDLPDIIHLLPEAFENPILGKIVWRKKSIAGVTFLLDLDDESLLINPVSGTGRNALSSMIENEALRSRRHLRSFRERFQLFAMPRTRKSHTSSVSGRQSRPNPVQDLISSIAHEFRPPLISFLRSLGLIQNGFGGALQEKLASRVNVAYRNAEKLKLILNDLFDPGKAGSRRTEKKAGSSAPEIHPDQKP
jgi:signal transduction histidine kinase